MRTGMLKPEELIVDNFAGGGGASTGIFMATGRHPDIAINHDPEAVAMHAANHPSTRHYCESVWDVNPRELANGRPVGLAWFSPDCKHFSKAKGGAPGELFHAQGFPGNYIIGDDPAQGLALTKEAQVRMCGNSVCPPVAAALVAANYASAAISTSMDMRYG